MNHPSDMNKGCGSAGMLKAALAVLTVAAALAGCNKQNLQTTYDNQDKKIEQYVMSQISASKAQRVFTNAGSTRLVISEGAGVDSLSTEGSVTIYYAAYTFNGSVSASNMFATNHGETARQNGWDVLSGIDTTARVLNLKDGDIVEGLRNGLFGVRTGEECLIMFSGKHGFGDRMVGTIPANSALLYHIAVLGIDNGD